MHTDVTATYMGLELRSPVVVGACPITLKPETVRELAIAGAGAVVLPSLLEEQIVREMIAGGRMTRADERRVEAAGVAPMEDTYNGGVPAYLRSISILKHHTGLPIIANMDGCTEGKWLDFASEIEQNGADAIELSLYPGALDPSAGADEVESSLLRAVETVCDVVSIPVSVKLLPFFTSLPNLAWRLTEVGASGIVLFGREAIWEIHEGDLVPTSHWSLSDAGQLQMTISGLIRLRTGGPPISTAASGGITTPKEAISAVIAGADVAMVTSEIYRTGPDAVAHLVEGIAAFLQREHYDSFQALVQRRRETSAGSATRRNYVRPMVDLADYRHCETRANPRSGDRWGHKLPSRLDDVN